MRAFLAVVFVASSAVSIPLPGQQLPASAAAPKVGRNAFVGLPDRQATIIALTDDDSADAAGMADRITNRLLSIKDSSAAQVPSSNHWPQRAWLSVGLGPGTSPNASLGGVLSGWYSVGIAAVGVRTSSVGQILVGEQRSDRAFLVGARTRGDRGFLLGALGIGRVSSSRTCDGPCSQPLPRPSARAAAYSVEGHANLELAGVGLTVFGALGPETIGFNAFALTVNFGWFGKGRGHAPCTAACG